MEDLVKMRVTGHVVITDQDTGEVVLDKYNAVNTQNLSRAFARSLANESNGGIFRMAFGNGGTSVDSAHTVTYRTPNVGTWDARLYRETFSKVIDQTSPFVGQDLGSADSQTGIRAGGGAVVDLSLANNVVSSEPETAIISSTIATCTIGPNEPRGQFITDFNPPTSSTETDFVFDEIGLYTHGLQPLETNGYQLLDVGNKKSTDVTGLLAGGEYAFDISVDGANYGVVNFKVPSSGGTGPGGAITYGDLCEALNTRDVTWLIEGYNNFLGAKFSITDETNGAYPSITNAQTYGFLKIESVVTGASSLIDMEGPNTVNFAAAFQPQAIIVPSIPGQPAGDKNNISNPTNERERLLCHLIFSPVEKAGNRTLVVTYRLTIAIEALRA